MVKFMFEGSRRPTSSIDGGRWVVFRLDEGRYALPLAAVHRVVRAVYVTGLPRAPVGVLGAVNVAGCILPVFDLRERFGLPARRPDVADHFLIAHTPRRTVVLAIDAAEGVIDQPLSALVPAARIAPGLEQLKGVIPLSDGLLLIQDLDRLLSAEETHSLDEALTEESLRAG